MNTLQNVYDRLSDKTELAKHEVELTTISQIIEIDKKNRDFINYYKKIIPEIQKSNVLLDNIKKQFEIAKQKNKEGYKIAFDQRAIIKEYLNQAKALGINEADAYKIKEFASADKSYDELNKLNDELLKLI
jgi:hypothetical protein